MEDPTITPETRRLIIYALTAISIGAPALHIVGGALGVEMAGDPWTIAMTAVGALAGMAVPPAKIT